MFRSFDDVLDHLDRLGLFNSDYELTRMRRAIASLRVEDGWRPTVIQILGTNGKGSTATFIAALARAHGVRTGLYTSPHFVSPRERIRIDGEMPSVESLVPLADRVISAAPGLTYFEFLTVLGLLAFKAAGCSLVVLEAGLGGRYDATTAMRADIACYVPIDLDHCAVLGPTVAAIAEDKGDAIRPGCPVVTGVQHPDALAVLRRMAAERKSPLHMAADIATLPDGVALGLMGPHQRGNALLALAAWNVAAGRMGVTISPEAVGRGLSGAYIPGRFQLVPPCGRHPACILDGGHNPHGLCSCRAALHAYGIRPSAVIFSCLADKAYGEMLPIVMDMAQGVPLYLCTIQGNERAMDGEVIAEECGRLADPGNVPPSAVTAVPRLAVALDRAAGDADGTDAPVLICGSLYLLGEFFTMRTDLLEKHSC